MRDVLIRITVVVAGAILWFAGLRLFLRTDLTRRWKLAWTAFLLLVGIGIGLTLPLSQIWRKFFWAIVIVPALGLADVGLLRSGRGLSYWIRACGFEVCTVFAAAGAVRYLLDVLGAVPLFPALR